MKSFRLSLLNLNSRDDVSDIAKYYSLNDEDSRIARQQLEVNTTGFVLNYYLPESAHILELGAGTGHYTEALAEEGYRITAVDLTPELVNANKKRVARFSDKVAHIAGDARDVLTLTDDLFDAVLVMGPLYHLNSEKERTLLVRNIHKRLKPDGLMISTHLSRHGFYSYMLSQHPLWLRDHKAELAEIWENGFVSNIPKTGVFRGYYTTVNEIQALHKEGGFELSAIQC